MSTVAPLRPSATDTTTTTAPAGAQPLVGPVPGVDRPVRHAAGEPTPDRRRRLARLPVGVLFAVLAIAQAVNFTRFPGSYEDEGTYVSQAWSLWTHGELSHYAYWYDHPPAAWAQIAAWVFPTDALSRHTSAIGAGREFMLLVSVASIALLYLLARRLGFSRAVSAIVMTLFALSPVSVRFHRMVLLDNISMLWVLGALVLAASPKRRLSAYVGAAFCLAMGVLSKETALLFLPAVLLMAVQRLRSPAKAYALAVSASLFVLMCGLYVLLAAIKGELIPGPGHVSLWEAVEFQLFSRAGTGSLLDPASETRRLANFWLRDDPWLPVAGLVLVPLGLAVRRLRFAAVTLLLLLAMLLRSGYTPFMQVVGALPFCALLVGGAVDQLARRAEVAAPAVTRVRDEVRRQLGSKPGARRPDFRGTSLGLAVTVALTGAVTLAVLPDWKPRLAYAFSADEDRVYRQANSWVRDNTRPDDALLVDNSLWLDAVLGGHDRERTVWYYKLDPGPGIKPFFARGWREFSYVFETENLRANIRGAPGSLPETREALRHSVLLERFGRDDQRIDVRRVVTPESAQDPRVLGQIYGPASAPSRVPGAGEARGGDSTAALADRGELPAVADAALVRDTRGRLSLVNLSSGTTHPVSG